MLAMEMLSHLTGLKTHNLAKEEIFILEATLFTELCEELKQVFREKFKSYFHFMKVTKKKEERLIEEKLVGWIVNDILYSEEYTLAGIAFYTHTCEEVIYDIATGLNTQPSSMLLQRIIKLHSSIRPELYQDIVRKIIHRMHQASAYN